MISPQVLEEMIRNMDKRGMTEEMIDVPWYAEYLKDGEDHQFGTVLFGDKEILVELEDARAAQGHINISVRAIEGKPFRQFVNRSDRANGAPPIVATDWECGTAAGLHYKPVAKIVNGEYCEYPESRVESEEK